MIQLLNLAEISASKAIQFSILTHFWELLSLILPNSELSLRLRLWASSDLSLDKEWFKQANPWLFQNLSFVHFNKVSLSRLINTVF